MECVFRCGVAVFVCERCATVWSLMGCVRVRRGRRSVHGEVRVARVCCPAERDVRGFLWQPLVWGCVRVKVQYLGCERPGACVLERGSGQWPGSESAGWCCWRVRGRRWDWFRRRAFGIDPQQGRVCVCACAAAIPAGMAVCVCMRVWLVGCPDGMPDPDCACDVRRDVRRGGCLTASVCVSVSEWPSDGR